MLVVQVDMAEPAHLVSPNDLGTIFGQNSKEDRFIIDGRWGHCGKSVRDPDRVEECESGTVLDDEERERRDRRGFEHVTGRRLRR